MTTRPRFGFFLLLLASLAASEAFAAPAPSVSLLDLVELDYGYTTIADHYYTNVAPQRILDGARSGMLAYLRSRGIANPRVEPMHARADGRGVVPAIEQQIALAIHRYGERIVVADFVHQTLAGELAELHDPYTVFFSKAELTKFSTFLDGTAFGGIGVVVALDDATKRWRVEELFSGGPADKAGVREGDEIEGVGGTPLAGLDAAAVEARLRGKVGTVARLAIVRDGTPLAQPVAVTRAAVTPPDVTARLLPSGIAYVALHSFGANAGGDVRAAVRRLDAQGARALVFDLRGNGGGYEVAAVHVASVFVAHGPIVSVQRNHGARQVTLAEGNALASRPLAVLVDGDSASGSELVAGALHDRALATLVGVRTFGKGLVQEMFPLPDGAAMKVTTARYYTPSGKNIDRIGITPDVVVDEPAGSVHGVPGRDAQLDRALALLATGPSPAPSPAPSPSPTF